MTPHRISENVLAFQGRPLWARYFLIASDVCSEDYGRIKEINHTAKGRH